MTFTFAATGEREACLKALASNLEETERAETAARADTLSDGYFESLRSRLTSLIQGAPDTVYLSLSVTGDAHTGYFSCSFNQPAQVA